MSGFDDKIIAMYARGMTVREIRAFLFEQYGTDVSPDFISLNMGGHESLRKGLGISTMGLVHHWSKAGAPGAMPGRWRDG